MRKTTAETVKGDVLAENQAKIDSYEKSIRAALERKRKVIIESKLYTYGQLSELYALIQKLTDSGMTYEQIGELADDSSASKYGKQMSFSESNHSYSE